MGIELPLTSSEAAARYRSLGLWKDVTLYERFAAVADRYPDKLAIIDQDRRVSYASLRRQIDTVAANLLALGLMAGDVVALQTWNSLEMPLLHLACNRIGLLYLPLHDGWREQEMQHLLMLAKARVIVIPAQYRGFDHVGMITALRPALPDLEHVYLLEGGASGCKPFSALLSPSRTISAPDLDRRRPDPDMPAATMLSGGTTALSKISRFSSNDLLVLLDCFAKPAELAAEDIAAALAPAGTGSTGYVFPILTPLMYGATSVILTRWGDPDEALNLIVENRCTFAVAIPTQMTRLVPSLEQRQVSDFENLRLFFNAGAPLPYETGLRIEELMGCIVQCMYGTTDGGVPCVTSIRDSQEKRLRTVGHITPGCECQLWDADGSQVPSGEVGEIVWRSADKSWGYLGDDEQTAQAFTQEHWYRSGDLGQLDAEGYMRIVGRVKDMILRGGRNLSPRTIENPLMKHPAVLDAAVAAMPDAILGERACAFVVVRPGKNLTFDEMIAFLKLEGLAVWHLPERLEIVEDFPRGPGGKVVKNALTELVTERMKRELRTMA